MQDIALFLLYSFTRSAKALLKGKGKNIYLIHWDLNGFPGEQFPITTLYLQKWDCHSGVARNFDLNSNRDQETKEF